MSTCTWPLNNNETLEFTIYDPTSTTWNKVAGLYIFTYRTDDTHWTALYVGKADDFSERIPSHERWLEAVQLGATHVHALGVPLEANRDNWEKMLIQHLQPPMNQQLR
jgi:hypothetical protein